MLVLWGVMYGKVQGLGSLDGCTYSFGVGLGFRVSRRMA